MNEFVLYKLLNSFTIMLSNHNSKKMLQISFHTKHPIKSIRTQSHLMPQKLHFIIQLEKMKGWNQFLKTQLLNEILNDERSGKIWFNFLCLFLVQSSNSSRLLIILLSRSFKMHALYGFINLKLYECIIYD